DRRTVGCQARRPAPGRHRAHLARPGPQGRRQGPAERPGGAPKRGYVGSSTSCPTCRGPARFERYQAKAFVSLLGPVRTARAYYPCPACHKGHCPADAALRLGADDLTLGAREAVCLAGLLASFAEARAKVLPKLAGLRLGESTVERATEAAGARLGALLAAGQRLRPPGRWDWHKGARGQSCAYGSGDATRARREG